MEGVERRAAIRQFESELADINATLQRVMAATIHLSSWKQREMDRWKKLAPFMWDNPEHNVAEAGDSMKEERIVGASVTIVSNTASQDLKGAPRCQEHVPTLKAIPPLTRQGSTEESCRSSATEKDGNTSASHSPLNESMLSAETVSKLGRMRQQEKKVRGILSKMKKSLKKSSA
jgi:hypothetical protein